MEIICPKCGYARLVPEGKIPATAEIATCPKCKARFKFRDASGVADTPVPPQPAAEARAARVPPDFSEAPARTRSVPQEQKAPEPKTPEAPVEDIPDGQKASRQETRAQQGQVDAAYDDNVSATPPQETPRPGPQDDFWDKLETMGSPQAPSDDRQTRFRTANHSDVPWEELETYGFFHGMFQTIKQVMLSPIDFFKSMPVRGGIGRPLVFYLLISEVVAVFAFIFQMLGMAALTTMAPAENAVDGLGMFSAMGIGGSAMILILYPVLFTIGLFINSGITHFFLMLFKAADSGFEATFRVSAYGNAPIVLAIIPLVGPIVGTIWALFVLIIGFKYAHRASYGQVIMALLTPLLLLFVLVILIATAIPFLALG